MACEKHPGMSGPGELCPVCLLEQALEPASLRDLIIQLPLGHGIGTSVFLVCQEAPSAALLRLKVWRSRAPASFLDDIAELQARLDEIADPAVVPPIAACLDAGGCPAVLSVFRQGLPILQAVRSGVLDAGAALTLCHSLDLTLTRCHAAGLAHGAILPGNVLVQPDGRAGFLVDYGLAGLFRDVPFAEAAAADRAGLAALARTLPAPGSQPATTSA